MKRFGIAALAAAIGCGDDAQTKTIDAPNAIDASTVVRSEVLSLPAAAIRSVDILFMIDDSPSMLDKQQSLIANFPNFVNVIDGLPGGRPDLHIGVVTSDLGTSAADGTAGPNIGSGNGACAAQGKAGSLTTNGSTLVVGKFISDIAGASGRNVNYTGTLAAAFTSIASVGQSGCGFEQPLEAVKRALDNNNVANAGFVRHTNLMVVFLTDEDDCSLQHPALLQSDQTIYGPLQSFRCTRFGITCDTGGTTPDEMNQIGAKSGCHSNESGTDLTKVSGYATFLAGIAGDDPRNVMVSALVAPATPVAVELRSPGGGTTPSPALARSCTYQNASGMPAVGDPAVRITELANKFDRHTVDTVCQNDLSAGLADIASQLGPLLGSPCLTKAIAMPADCVVTDVTLAGASTVAPKCPGADPCYAIATDATTCPAAPQLSLKLTRTSPAPAGTVTVVKCKLP